MWLILPILAAIYLSGHDASNHDQDLIDKQPHQTATVVTTYRSPISGRGESPEVTVDVGGRRAVLALSFPGEEDVAPGDTLDVAVDPDDPGYVIAVNSHDDWAYTSWGELVVIGGIGLLGGGLWFGWALAVPHRSARTSGRRARAVHVVHLVEVEGTRLALRDADGQLWSWTGDETTWSGGGPANVRLVGELRPGSWPAVAAERGLYWPHMPVQPASQG